jgi:hypothetical protein
MVLALFVLLGGVQKPKRLADVHSVFSVFTSVKARGNMHFYSNKQYKF